MDFLTKPHGQIYSMQKRINTCFLQAVHSLREEMGAVEGSMHISFPQITVCVNYPLAFGAARKWAEISGSILNIEIPSRIEEAFLPLSTQQIAPPSNISWLY